MDMYRTDQKPDYVLPIENVISVYRVSNEKTCFG